MSQPKIIVDTDKLRHNAETIVKLCRDAGIGVSAVTKAVCADIRIARIFIESGADMLADSRVINLKKLAQFPVPKMMLRIPMLSEVDDVVMYSDFSLNSEMATIKALSAAAERQNRTHGIVIMVEMGDLREGVQSDEALEFAREAYKLPRISLAGIGVNFNCYGGVIPDEKSLSEFVSIAGSIENEFGVRLKILSGGNSGSLYLLKEKKMPRGINNLRIGEAILLGRETSFGQTPDGLYTDAFTLCAEIVEIKDKPSVPFGRTGLNAFGQKQEFEDKGIIKRAILACGRQDTICDQLTPRTKGARYLGASSDHMIFDITNAEKEFIVGDIVNFSPSYGALVSAFTSKYVSKVFR